MSSAWFTLLHFNAVSLQIKFTNLLLGFSSCWLIGHWEKISALWLADQQRSLFWLVQRWMSLLRPRGPGLVLSSLHFRAALRLRSQLALTADTLNTRKVGSGSDTNIQQIFLPFSFFLYTDRRLGKNKINTGIHIRQCRTYKTFKFNTARAQTNLVQSSWKCNNYPGLPLSNQWSVSVGRLSQLRLFLTATRAWKQPVEACSNDPLLQESG